MSTAKQIFEEELNKFADSLDANQAKKVLMEDNTILNSLLKAEESVYDHNNQITESNWEWFKDTLIKCSDSSIFQYNCKSINLKLYAVKYFTNVNFMIAESVEDEVKVELKKYFGSINTDNAEDFIKSFFELPFEFTSLVVRYLANILLPEKKNLLTPTVQEADSSLKGILSKKNSFIENINDVSMGRSSTLSIVDASLLLDVKAFYNNNALNVGALEFLVRLFRGAKSKLGDIFSKEKIKFMLVQILSLPSYQTHIRKIQQQEEQPFFTKDGSQNLNRDVTYDDYVTQYFNPEEYVPKPTEAKETPDEGSMKQQSKTPPTEEAGVKQPSQEELLKQ